MRFAARQHLDLQPPFPRDEESPSHMTRFVGGAGLNPGSLVFCRCHGNDGFDDFLADVPRQV